MQIKISTESGEVLSISVTIVASVLKRLWGTKHVLLSYIYLLNARA